MTLAHFLYRSNGRLDHFNEDCANILAAARIRNAGMNLSGFLHAEEGIFVQWLEGPKPMLDVVVDDILTDPRHSDVTVFGRGPIARRQFPSWAMGYSSGAQAPLFDWLAERGTNSHDVRGFADCLHQFLLLRAA